MSTIPDAAARAGDIVDLMITRVSPARLVAPAPSEAELERILRAGARAPDHGRLRPWRFVIIDEAARPRFSEMLAASLRARKPEASDAELQRERDKALRAPLIIAVAARPVQAKVPEIEQVLAVAACTENMILAAHALGYGATWKTGDAAYDDAVKAGLGLEPGDAIVAFLYLGTTAAAPPSREPMLEGLVQRLAPN
ncbi:nitroreductase family protein [Pigmentiphaga soli]|uniref:Putative NAD(P)H nitroreductase n=1 Tax=Pigmentiphaga soli TaxID=1007095 RepID=A0ABP8H5F2_9BURK